MASKGNIADYENPDTRLSTSTQAAEIAASGGRQAAWLFNVAAAAGEHAGQLEARAIGGAIAAAGGVFAKAGKSFDNYLAGREISLGGKAQSAAFSALNSSYTDALRNPQNLDNLAFASNFRQNVLEPSLDQFTGQFSTQAGKAWAERQAGHIRQHFETQMPHDMSNLASAAFQHNTTETLNSAASTVMADPTTLDLTMKTVGDTINSAQALLAPGVKSDAVDKANEKLVMSAIYGWGQRGPEGIAQAREVASTYAKYIKNAAGVARGIQTMERFQEADAKHAEAVKEKQLAADRDIFTYDKSKDPNASANDFVLSPLFVNDQKALNTAIKTFNTARQLAAGELTTSPVVEHAIVQDLRRRINLPDEDENKIRSPETIDAVLDQIGLANRDKLRGELKAAQAPAEKRLHEAMSQGFKDYKDVLAPSTGRLSTAGDQSAVFRAQSDFTARADALRREGKDPMALVTPGSPDNFFTLQNLMSYRTDLTTKLREQNNLSSHDWSSSDIARAASVISAHLEGAGYQSVGRVTEKGDVALGKYQVMRSNVAGWTREALGKSLTPQQFINSPSAQDAVFEHRFGGYLRKYGPDGAARAWYAGEGGMNNLGATDVNRKITVGGYGRKFSSIFGASNYDVRNPAPRELPPGTTGKYILDHPDLYPPGTEIIWEGVRRIVPGKAK